MKMLTLKTYKRRKDPAGKLVHIASVVASSDDLLREFLFRLPVISLLRFKSVSKHWLSLITDPCFTRDYSFRNPLRVSGIFFRTPSPVYKFIFLDSARTSAPFKSLAFINNGAGVTILHSCNGLLCCSSFGRPSSTRPKDYYICNPTIKQYTTLPRPSVSLESFVCSLTLAFDPLKSPEYKVVCAQVTTGKYQLMIYSLSAPYWRASGETFNAYDNLLHKSGIFWNGAVHWIRLGESSVCFHVDREVFVEMPMPPILVGPDGEAMSLQYTGASRDHLYLVMRYEYTCQLHILEMESDYSRWNVKYRIDIRAMAIANPQVVKPSSGRPSVLFVQGEPDVPTLILKFPDQIIMYNLKEETVMELQELSTFRNSIRHYSRFDAYSYLETFSCV